MRRVASGTGLPSRVRARLMRGAEYNARPCGRVPAGAPREDHRSTARTVREAAASPNGGDLPPSADQWQPKQLESHLGQTSTVPFACSCAHTPYVPFGPQSVAGLSPVAAPFWLIASGWQSSHAL